mgnify:FL=1
MSRKPSAKRPSASKVMALVGDQVWNEAALAAALGVTLNALERTLLSAECDDVFCRGGVVVRCRWYSPDPNKPYFAVIDGGRSTPAAMALAQHHQERA